MDAAKKVLVFLENEAQVIDFLKKHNASLTTLIALSPFAMHELDKNNFKYKIPEDYYGAEELYQFGMENYKKVERICSIIDDLIHEQSPEFKKKGITPAAFGFFHLKLLYDSILLRTFQLSKIICAENPDEILFYGQPSRLIGFSQEAFQVLFDNSESIYSILLSLDQWSFKPVILGSIKTPTGIGFFKRAMCFIRNKVKPLLKSHSQAETLRLDLSEKSMDKFPVIFFGGKYNWGSCMRNFKDSGIFPILELSDDVEYWAVNEMAIGTADVPPDPKKIMDCLRSNSEFCSLFIFENIDVLPIAGPRLLFLFNRVAKACMNSYLLSNSFSKRNGIGAMLTSGFSNPIAKSFAKAALDIGIPVFSWQHGNYGYLDQPMIPYSDFVKSGIHLVFGEGVVEKYGKQAKQSGTELVPIGSSNLDKLSSKKLQGKEKKKSFLLYASTNLYHNHLYVSFPPMWSDNLFWRSQKHVLETIGKQRKMPVVVKLHPNIGYRSSPIVAYAEEKEFSDLRFIQAESTFDDLAPYAGVFVIDFPSTTLLQAITTNKPVFTTTQHCRLDKDAEILLKKRAYCFKTVEEMSKAINSFLDTGSVPGYDVDLNNHEFLKRYGTHLDDGKSAERAAKLVYKKIHCLKNKE
ncbi:MAG: hypothetical protein ABII22_05950 [Candidatus Micrarchaeota archaeon]